MTGTAARVVLLHDRRTIHPVVMLLRYIEWHPLRSTGDELPMMFTERAALLLVMMTSPSKISARIVDMLTDVVGRRSGRKVKMKVLN